LSSQNGNTRTSALKTGGQCRSKNGPAALLVMRQHSVTNKTLLTLFILLLREHDSLELRFGFSSSARRQGGTPTMKVTEKLTSFLGLKFVLYIHDLISSARSIERGWIIILCTRTYIGVFTLCSVQRLCGSIFKFVTKNHHAPSS
jgi:hypothetical protein